MYKYNIYIIYIQCIFLYIRQFKIQDVVPTTYPRDHEVLLVM